MQAVKASGSRIENKSGKAFKISVSDVQAYKQFGNSVAIPAIIATGKKIVNIIKEK